MLNIIAIAISYLLGSLSSAIIISRLLGLKDPRKSGSGNAGATNMLRISGKKTAALVLLGDLAKGVIAILIATNFLDISGFMLAFCGLAAVLGHIFPVFFKFKGGKGVATGAGVILALNPGVGLAIVATWLLVAVLSRYSSLAAVVACATTPIYMLMWQQKSYFIPMLILAVLIVIKHHANIRRLVQGNEKKISFSKTKS